MECIRQGLEWKLKFYPIKNEEKKYKNDADALINS